MKMPAEIENKQEDKIEGGIEELDDASYLLTLSSDEFSQDPAKMISYVMENKSKESQPISSFFTS